MTRAIVLVAVVALFFCSGVAIASDHWIEGKSDVVPTWYWTAGCSPTAATMVLGYWDWTDPYGSRWTSYGKLVPYYMRRSVIQNYQENPAVGTDYFKYDTGSGGDPDGADGIPFTVYVVAYAALTDAPDGGTDMGYFFGNDLKDGIATWTNAVCGYNFTVEQDYTEFNWEAVWSQIKGEIDAGCPCIWNRSGDWPHGINGGHSVAVIGYSDDGYVYYYDTWDAGYVYSPYQGNGQTFAGDVRITPDEGSNGNDVELEVPLGYEEWRVGTEHDITWYQFGDDITGVDVEYSTDGGYTWVEIAQVASHKGENSYTWTIPNTPSENCMVGIEAYADDTYTAADGSQDIFSITPAMLTVTSASLPDGKVGEAYAQTVEASGGLAPYSWAIVAGSLPPGLLLDTGTGTISGTPTAYGTSLFTVQVTDSWSPANTATKALSIRVDPAMLTITTPALPDAVQGSMYSQTLAATGGVPPYTWTISAGGLPYGLNLSTTGVISGVPTSYGTSDFTVQVVDSWTPAGSATKSLSIMTKEKVIAPTLSPPPGIYGAVTDVTIACATAGAAIRYTTDGSTPTSSHGTVYSGPVRISNTTTLSAVAYKAGAVQSDATSGIYKMDYQCPVTFAISTVPTMVRSGTTPSLTAMATASDVSTGGSDIVAAEYFIGPDPGAGHGTVMSAADGAFDSFLESLTATVDTSSWVQGTYRINIRARDAAGNWTSPVANIDVSVVDGTPPGAVQNLRVEATGQLPVLSQTSWSTAGTLSSGEEEKTIDLGSAKSIGGVSLVVGRPPLLFPRDFRIVGSLNGTDWTLLAQADSFRPVPGKHVWQVEAGDYRYIKVVATSVLNRRDRHYYVRVPEIAVIGIFDQARINATWTAPADDGYVGAPASQYDLRYSTAPITPGNFGSCTSVGGVPAPGVPGSRESGIFSFDANGTVYFALKAADEVPNWSGLSNVAWANVSAPGFVATAPSDGAQLNAGMPSAFVFETGADIKPVFIEFSSTPGFIGKPTKSSDGRIYKTLRFPVKPGSASWTPSAGQWKAIKKIVPAAGTLYWRLSGRSKVIGNIYGRMMTGHFDCGEISDLAVALSHQTTPPGESSPWESIWPDRDNPPAFSWSDNTNGMRYFYIDVSTDPSMPMKDRKKSVTICRRGTGSNFYTPNKGEWKKIRQIATGYWRSVRWPEPAEGRLYWRVRAADKDKALTCASAVKPLYIDGGAFSGLHVDTDPLTQTPRFGWTHTGQGIEWFCMEFCADDQFTPGAKYTLKVPGGYVQTGSYTLRSGEVKRLQRFADKNGAGALYWRVRGVDTDKKFVGYSGSSTWSP